MAETEDLSFLETLQEESMIEPEPVLQEEIHVELSPEAEKQQLEDAAVTNQEGMQREDNVWKDLHDVSLVTMDQSSNKKP